MRRFSYHIFFSSKTHSTFPIGEEMWLFFLLSHISDQKLEIPQKKTDLIIPIIVHEITDPKVILLNLHTHI